MVSALRRHVRLLETYAHKVYVENDDDYAGEIAGKLRLLVTSFGSNEPLLLQLMRETGIEPPIVLGGPPQCRQPGKPGPGDTITLEQYMNLDAIGIRVPSGAFVETTKSQFIRAWAQQTGSSHEDWAMDESVAAILSSPICIGGVPGALAELKTTVDAVLNVAHKFLEALDAPSTSSDN